MSQNIEDFAPLFSEIADAYFEKALYAEAKPVYEMLGADATVRIKISSLLPVLTLFSQTSSIQVLIRTADCRRFLEDFDGALEVYEHSAFYTSYQVLIILYNLHI